ncbi:MAG: FAD-binding protein [Coriobacteriia bacterium]
MEEKQERESRGISRRAFLGGAAAVSATAALGLVGCSAGKGGSAAGSEAATASGATQTTDPSKAVWPVVEEFEAKPAGEGVVAFVKDPIADKDIVKTYDVDAVVCGLGPAGFAAALSCAENGLKTVAVEKRESGNYNSATIGGTNSKIHQHWGMTYDLDEWMSDAMVNCAFQGDMGLYRHWLETNGEAVDWYVSHFDNQDLNSYPLTFAGGDFPTFRDQWDKTSLSRSWNTSINLPYKPTDLPGIMAKAVEAAGGEIRYQCPAVQLVTDDKGKVTGVIVKSDAGYEKYNCAKGVVLATGGYECNVEMLKERCRPRGIPGHWLVMHNGNTGDGHQMGLAVGAAEDDFPQAIMLDPQQLMPYVRVNKLGKRFTPEYEPYNHLALAIQAQPGAHDFYIVDGKIAEKIDKIWTPSSSCYGPKEIWVGAATSDKALKADSLEELAKLMDIPADTFVETIKRWNEMAAAGKDEDFNFPGSMMMTIDTPPFYANKEYADGLCTAGGLIVNTEGQVLDKNRDVIEGLYAIGLTSGGMFYDTYPHNLNCLSHTRNCLMGYLAGKSLAGK